jgi:hypothetical protein
MPETIRPDICVIGAGAGALEVAMPAAAGEFITAGRSRSAAGCP